MDVHVDIPDDGNDVVTPLADIPSSHHTRRASINSMGTASSWEQDPLGSGPETPPITLTPVSPSGKRTADVLVSLYSESEQEKNIDMEMLGSILTERYAESDVSSLEPIWIDIQNPTLSDVQMLQERFGLHPLTTEDVFEKETREKCDTFDEYLLVVVEELSMDDYSYLVYKRNFNMILLPKMIISIHIDPVQCVDNVISRMRLRNQGHIAIIAPEWILYAILDSITDHIMPEVNFIVLESEAIDDLVLVLSQNEQADLLQRIGIARRKCTELMQSLKPKQHIISQLLVSTNFVNQRTRVYLKDILDHLVRMTDNTILARETLSTSYNTYMAKINIEVANASIQLNEVMKTLSAVATMMLPLSLIAGIFGMNVKVPGQNGDDFGWFFGLCAFMVVSTVLMFKYLRRRSII